MEKKDVLDESTTFDNNSSPVEVRLSSSNKMWILYKGEVIHESILPETNKMLKKEKRIEELLKKRGYAKDVSFGM